MSKVYYSAWEDTIIDNREKRFFEIKAMSNFSHPDNLHNG